MTADWMKSLEALRDTLPQGEEAPQEETAGGREDDPAGQPRLDVVLDKKNRKGKAATIVAGFTFSDSEVAAVAQEGRRAEARYSSRATSGSRCLRLLSRWGSRPE